MERTAVYDKWKEKLEPVLRSKAEEFEILGYGRVDSDTIWGFVVEHVVRKHPEEPLRLHAFVNELMSYSLNDYMTRLRKDSLRGPDWFTDDEPLDLRSFEKN